MLSFNELYWSPMPARLYVFRHALAQAILTLRDVSPAAQTDAMAATISDNAASASAPACFA